MASLARLLLAAGTAAAVTVPVMMNLVSETKPGQADSVLEMAAAGPFEALPDGQAGRPISTVLPGASFAWTFRYCLRPGLPVIEMLELRSLSDGVVILRVFATIAAAQDGCQQGTGTVRIPVDTRRGRYELMRRVASLPTSGASATMLASIPIEVIP